MRTYISGKITDMPLHVSKANFLQAEILLMQLHDISPKDMVNPMTIPPLFGIKNWYCYMISDLFVMVFFCRQIALQPNWRESRGARIEKWIADFLNFKIIEL